MRRLAMLAWAHLRKAKSVSFILALMFLIAALLLNAGLLVLINYGNHFSALTEELSPTDVYYAMPDALYGDEVASYFDKSPHVKKTQVDEALWLNAKMKSQATEDDKSPAILFFDMDQARAMSKWKFVGQHLPAQKMSVYVPDLLRAVDGYQLDDKIELTYIDLATGKEKPLTLTIRGYTEDIFFSGADTGFTSFYLPEDTYRQVQDRLGTSAYAMHVTFANIYDFANASLVESELRDILHLQSASLMVADPTSTIVAIDRELIGQARCAMAYMVSMMMVLFAVIIVAVCLLVAHFRIVNSIEEDALKIGSLKSIGYTTRQIIGSIALQFFALASLGGIVGVALSYLVLPFVSNIFERQSGLKWTQGFDPLISSITFVTLISITLLVVVLAARHIRTLSPINALRGETSLHTKHRNRLALDKTPGSISIVLALKSMVQNMKQTLMITFVVVVVAFAGAYGVIMYYNTSVDSRAFAQVPGFEICNAIVMFDPASGRQADIEKTIRQMDGVRKTLYLDEVKVRLDTSDVSAFVMDDYSQKESRLVYEGTYPEKSDEVTLAGLLSKRLGKAVGDVVTIKVGDQKSTFTIVGLANGSGMGGSGVSMLTEDYRRFNPDFKQQMLNIYLDESTDTASFVKTVKNEFDTDEIIEVLDFDKALAEGMSSYQTIVAALGVGILVITISVIALALYFIISTSIVRQRRELGIYKAVGFSTVLLMNQISIGFIIPVALGAATGSVLGAFCTNPLMSLIMSESGFMKADFLIPPYWVAGFCGAIIIFSYVLTMTITWRIRKISAYALVTE